MDNDARFTKVDRKAEQLNKNLFALRDALRRALDAARRVDKARYDIDASYKELLGDKADSATFSDSDYGYYLNDLSDIVRSAKDQVYQALRQCKPDALKNTFRVWEKEDLEEQEE